MRAGKRFSNQDRFCAENDWLHIVWFRSGIFGSNPKFLLNVHQTHFGLIPILFAGRWMVYRID